MAYGVLVSLSQTIDEILNHDGDFISHNKKKKKRIKSIHKQVIFLLAFLDDFPEKVNTYLEGKIMDVSTEAEDVIEYFMWKKQYESCYGHPSDKKRKGYRHWWRRRRHDLGELERLAKEFDSIAGEAMRIKNVGNKDIRSTVDSRAAGSATTSSSSSSSSRLVATSHKKEAMVGFDDDLLAIKERLCGESSKLQVIPIVGMGGIGKTTLVRSAYHDQLITEHFHIRAWVTVSQDYSAQNVFSELLNSVKGLNTGRSDQSNEDEEEVYKILKGKKYLIVMDDMWSTQAWDDVRRVFPDDNNGSRIMLTTRLSDVAAYADSCSRVHQMRLMGMDQSWDLIRRRVFSHEKECPRELEYIGKKIARRCGGLPLAIAMIAGLLSTSINPASWEEIADNVKSAISSTTDGHIERVLSLSYTHLPHHLRPCFLYMGGFPEDYEINISKLIKLWVAEGFLKYPSGSKSYEEVAEEYLEDLVKRSLVLVTMTRSNGKIKSCSVHDLVRDLCVRKAKELRLFTLVNKSSGEIGVESMKYQRLICITSPDVFFPAYVGNSEEILRTVRCLWSTSTSLGRHSGNCRLLRILDMEYSNYVESLPVEVFKLFRLRYLAFCSNNVEIPADISNLRNLQTLIIKCRESPPVYLPLEFWKMRQLRHLVSPVHVFLPFLAIDTSTCALANLVTLEISVDVMRVTAGMFKMIPNLKKLKISYFDGGYGIDDYHLDELVHLHQLETLTLNRVSFYGTEFNPTFPKTLIELTLSGWYVPWDCDVMRNVGSLPNLQVLKLRSFAFNGKKWETREGEFSQLKCLLIEDPTLKQWITESSHFPRLESLLLHECRGLNEIPDGIGEIPTLELIELKDSDNNVSLVESAKRIQEEQRDLGNDALQLRLIRLNPDDLESSIIWFSQMASFYKD